MIRRSHALVQLNTQGKEGDGGGRGLILDKRQDGHWAGEMKGGGNHDRSDFTDFPGLGFPHLFTVPLHGFLNIFPEGYIVLYSLHRLN